MCPNPLRPRRPNPLRPHRPHPTAPTAQRLVHPRLHSSAIVLTWPYLARVSAIVPTWLPLLQVYKSSRSISRLRMCAQTPSTLTSPTAPPASALRPPPPPSALRPPILRRHHHHPHCPHRSPHSLLCHYPHLPTLGSGFQAFKKYLRLPICAQTPSPPSPPSQPPPPSVLRTPPCPQRFARHSTSSPTAFILCHCPHLVALFGFSSL